MPIFRDESPSFSGRAGGNVTGFNQVDCRLAQLPGQDRIARVSIQEPRNVIDTKQADLGVPAEIVRGCTPNYSPALGTVLDRHGSERVVCSPNDHNRTR